MREFESRREMHNTEKPAVRDGIHEVWGPKEILLRYDPELKPIFSSESEHKISHGGKTFIKRSALAEHLQKVDGRHEFRTFTPDLQLKKDGVHNLFQRWKETYTKKILDEEIVMVGKESFISEEYFVDFALFIMFGPHTDYSFSYTIKTSKNGHK